MKKSERLGQTFRNAGASAFVVGVTSTVGILLLLEGEFSGWMAFLIAFVYGLAYPNIYKDGKKIGRWVDNSGRWLEYKLSFANYSGVGLLLGIGVGLWFGSLI